MLSKKAKYGLKALTFLAKNQEDTKSFTIGEIAQFENIPKKFLESILLELKRNGVLASVKGKMGGYKLRVPADKINIASILRIIDGPIAPIHCVSLHFYGQCEDCQEEICLLKPFLTKVRDANLAIYENTSLQQLIDGST